MSKGKLHIDRSDEHRTRTSWIERFEEVDWFDLEFLLYALLGLGLLGLVLYVVGSRIWEIESLLWKAVFVTTVVCSLGSVIYDIRRKKAGLVTRSLLIGWGLCTLFLLLLNVLV